MLFTGVANRQAKPATSGFTMLELMVVLVMLAILSSVAIPNMRKGMRREQLAARAAANSPPSISAALTFQPEFFVTVVASDEAFGKSQMLKKAS